MDERDQSNPDSNGLDSFFKDGEDVQILQRDTVIGIGENGGLSTEERAASSFLRTIAEDDNIAGIVLSAIRVSGGIYSHVVVKDLQDKAGMGKTLDTVNLGLEHLETAAQKNASPHSYVRLGDRNPQEFVDWFRGEFHGPPKYAEDSPEGMLNFFQIAGSDQLVWLGALMFE